jgi:CRP-like cAMP-binding protein
MAKRASIHQVIERSLPFYPEMPDASSDTMFAWIERVSNYIEVLQGSIVHSPEEENDAVYLIQRGQIEFSHIRPDGTPHRWSVLQTGDFFGELRLQGSPGQPYIAQALAESNLWKLDRLHLSKLFTKHPETLREITSIIGHKHDLLFCFKS